MLLRALMVEVVIVAARTAAIAAATAVAADARPRVTAVVDVPLPATAVAVAIRRRAADRRMVVGHRTAADRRRAVAADMDGDTALDSFPAQQCSMSNIATLFPAVRRANRASHCFFLRLEA